MPKEITFKAEIPFPETLPRACEAGTKRVHASGLEIFHFYAYSVVHLTSKNSRGDITTGCSVPLPNNSISIRAVAEQLNKLADNLEAQGK